MPEPTLLDRLKGYVKPGAVSVSDTDNAFIQACLDEAQALVDNRAGVKYVAITSPVEVQHPEEVIYRQTFDTSTTITEWTAQIGGRYHDGNANQLYGFGNHRLTRTFPGLQVGRTYTFHIQAAFRDVNNEFVVVEVGVTGIGFITAAAPGTSGPPTQFAYTFTATNTTHEIYLAASKNTFYDNALLIREAWTEVVGELVTERISLVPDDVLERAYIEVASELYNRQQAPNGISQFASPDGSPIRVARDPMVAAEPILRPFLPGGFA